jgi:hypothetical protein
MKEGYKGRKRETIKDKETKLEKKTESKTVRRKKISHKNKIKGSLLLTFTLSNE